MSDLEHRLDVVEAAIKGAIALDLSNFDPEAVKARRAELINEAQQAAQQLLDKAAVEIAKPLSADERIARLESIAKSALGVNVG